MKRRILFFNQSREIGGTDTFLVNLLKYWPERTDELSLWCNRGHKGLGLYRELPADLTAIGFPTFHEFVCAADGTRWPAPARLGYKALAYAAKPLFFAAAVLALWRRLAGRQIDVVFANNGGYPGGELCQALTVAARLAGVRKIYMIVHNDPLPPRFPFRWWDRWVVDRLVAASVTEFVTVSRSCAERIGQRRGFSRIRVIYNGIPPERTDRLSLSDKRARLKLAGSERIVGSLGNYEERKGFASLIRAFRAVKNSVPDAKLYIIGSQDFPYFRTLADLVAELELQADVNLLGYLPEAGELIECFDLLAVPSIAYESFGLTSLEAMRYRKAVVAAATGGIPEVVRDGRDGYLVEPGNSEQLASRIIELLRQPERAAALGASGHERLLQHFTAGRMAAEYCALC